MRQKHPRIAVDIIIKRRNNKFVLIKRANNPFKDFWALPGGFVEYGETVEQAAIREAKEETGLDVEPLGILGVYSEPSRDPRGHVVSIVFLALEKGGNLKASSDAKQVEEFEKIPRKLAFDHKKILEDAKWFLST